MNASQKQEIKIYKVWDLPVRLFHWVNFLSVISLLFVVNLLTRFAWAFIGNRYARWSAFLPYRGGLSDARRYAEAVRQGQPQAYLGHNPLGRLAVTLLLLLMTTMAVTGLVRAGTDIYFPPFGSWVQGYIAADQVPPPSLKPYDETLVDAEKFQALKAFKSPFGKVHLYTAYTLLGMLLLHIAAVIVTEKKEGGAIISAMFTGKKYLSGRLLDATNQE